MDSPIFLLKVGSTLCAVEKETFLADRNIVEIFLNYIMSEEVRTFYGFNITNVRTEEKW